MNLPRFSTTAAALAAFLGTSSLVAAAPAREVTFVKHVLATEYWADGVNAADLNRDGHVDVIAGPAWYAGPDFKSRHMFYEQSPLPVEVSPSNSMFSFPYDFNGDGWTDILVLGRVLFHQAFWYENPGKAGEGGPWKKHFAVHRVFGESPAFQDIDGDGKPELLAVRADSDTPEEKPKRWGWFAPDWQQPTKPWTFHPITEKEPWDHYYHGQGLGDINGDGRLDLVLTDGWWEQPSANAPKGTLWTAHRMPLGKVGRGGAQILVYDIDGDRDNDVVNAIDSHAWGLSWFEQKRGADGAIAFTEHRMMGTKEEGAQFGVAFPNPHALAVGDLDGDGLLDVITGNRRRESDIKGKPEAMPKAVNYWFQLQRDGQGKASFTPRLIDDNSGLGVQITVTDVNADGVPDILTASKLGTFVFITQRR